MIRAIPNNGNPAVIVDSDVQSDIEDVMTALEYGCTEYTLETAASAAADDLGGTRFGTTSGRTFAAIIGRP